MYIKLKNPQQNSLRAGLIAACIVSALIIIISIACLFVVPSPSTLATTGWNLLKEMAQKDLGGAFIVGILILFLPLIPLLGFWEYFKNRHKWHKPDFVYALDFQPNDVLLVSDNPTALPYSDTFFKLVIHIKRVKAGKSNYVPAVTQLSLCFDSKEMPKGDFIPDDFKFDEQVTSDQFQSKDFQYMPAYQLDHVAQFKDIFPLVELAPHFRQFSYSFYMHDEKDDLTKYRKFVDEQIQTHLVYGVHLPYSKGQMIGRGVLFCFLLFMTVPSCLVLTVKPFQWVDLIFMIPWLGIILPLLVFQGIVPFIKQYKAYTALKRMGKK